MAALRSAKMAVEIHAPVKDANDVDSPICKTKKYDVRSRWIFPIAFLNVIASFSECR